MPPIVKALVDKVAVGECPCLVPVRRQVCQILFKFLSRVLGIRSRCLNAIGTEAPVFGTAQVPLHSVRDELAHFFWWWCV